jgi:hypothetical protein
LGAIAGSGYAPFSPLSSSTQHTPSVLAISGVINESTEFVCGPFEKYRRWRSVLNRLRTLFRAIKRVRERYAQLAAQCWTQQGLRIETPEGTRIAPLSLLLVRTAFSPFGGLFECSRGLAAYPRQREQGDGFSLEKQPQLTPP